MLVSFFFNDTATTEIYTLSLHDALPISDYLAQAAHMARMVGHAEGQPNHGCNPAAGPQLSPEADRKSTRLNSSHANISYAVFCLKKKKRSLFLHLFLFSLRRPPLSRLRS